jgi:hypothetical protein
VSPLQHSQMPPWRAPTPPRRAPPLS